MKQRIISGVIIAVAVVVLGLEGGIVLASALMVCSMIGYYEMTRALQVHDLENELISIFGVIGEIGTVLYFVYIIMIGAIRKDPSFGYMADRAAVIAVLAVFFACMGIYVFTFPKYKAKQVIGAVFSFIYIPILVSCIFKCLLLPSGRYVYVLCFLCSWVCDTCAYASGIMFGKHKMAKILSPKKTIEGAIGGIAGSVITCILTAIVAQYFNPSLQAAVPFAFIGLVGSLIGMTGDLAASAIKREGNIKDYGNVIPGHGGIMDRFDSVIFTAPVIYYLAAVFLK